MEFPGEQRGRRRVWSRTTPDATVFEKRVADFLCSLSGGFDRNPRAAALCARHSANELLHQLSGREVLVLTLVYLVLALLGCGYVIVATFLGHLTDAGDGDSGDGHGHAGEFHFPFFSPLAIAALFGALGGFGLIARYGFRAGDGMSLAVAGPAALVTSYVVTYLAWRVARSSTGSSQIRTADLAGAAGEVVTPIPAGGMGEVTVIVRGQRFTAPARAVAGDALPRGAMVTVEQYSGSTMVVRQTSEVSR